MAIDLSFIGRGVKPLNVGQGPIEDPTSEAAAKVAEMLSSMGITPGFENAPVPVPPQLPPLPSGGHQMLGGIGDALMAMAAIRAGGQPGPPQFQNRLMGIEHQRSTLQNAYQNATTEAEASNREMRNRIRLSLGSIAMRPGRAGANATGRGATVTMGGRIVNIIRDPDTGEVVSQQDLGEAPPGFQLGTDEHGNMKWFQKPMTSGAPLPTPAPPAPFSGAPAAAPVSQGPAQEPGYSAGAPPTRGGGAIQVYDENGQPVRAKPPENLLGIKQQLDSSEYLLNEMKANWLRRPKGMVRQGVGTAAANLLSRGTGANLGLSGVASMIDKHAVVHERDREAVATTLAFPLTGSRRSVEGARKSLLDIIPHYTDPPEVWNVFDQQMRQIIKNARSMPWGPQQETSQEAYGAMIDNLSAAMAIVRNKVDGGPGAGPYAGRIAHQSDFKPDEQEQMQQFIAGGGAVVP